MPTNNFNSRMALSRKFLPQIRQIIGGFLINEPPLVEDLEHATDLWLITPDRTAIAVRVRTFQWISCQHEFTVRWELPSGHITEHAKIHEGYGDWMVYAICNADETGLVCHRIIDLDVWRAHERAVPVNWNRNPFTGEKFRIYPYDDFPPELVAESQPWRGDVIQSPAAFYQPELPF